MPQGEKGRRVLAVATAVAIAACPVRAGNLDSEVNDMFDSLGAIGNYSAPGAFKGQTYNTFTGGSLYMRSPNKTYQLLALQYPTSKAGCGGIDLFGGSMSAISANEFKAMLENITAALPGIAFQIALDTVSPLLGGITKWAKSLESWVNNARINSCEAASSLVSNAMESTGVSATEMCAKIAVSTGLEADINKAKQRCKNDRASILKNSRDAGGPDSDLAPFVGNLTWKALKRIPSLDDPAREVAMSIIGTVIYFPEEQGKAPLNIGATIKDISQLLDGQSDAGSGKINVQMLRCNNYIECDDVRVVDNATHKPLTARVEEMMTSLADHIRNRQRIPESSPLVGFVNTTTIPVWRLLSVGSALPQSDLTPTLIQSYKHVIASDYAVAFLNKFANVGLTALLQHNALDVSQQKDIERLRNDLKHFLSLLYSDQSVRYQKLASASQVASDIERLDRTMRMNMSSHVVDLLRHSYVSR